MTPVDVAEAVTCQRIRIPHAIRKTVADTP